MFKSHSEPEESSGFQMEPLDNAKDRPKDFMQLMDSMHGIDFH